MTGTGLSVDPIWEELYNDGKHLNKYPFNNVPSFFFRYVPRDIPREQVNVMEVGFGSGNNLWMCAREGTQVCGVDAAPSGVKHANEWFAREGLNCDLRVGDFTSLPFEDASVHMTMNRQALTQVSHSRARVAVNEIHRCLTPGGVFWSNMFSDQTYKVGNDLGDGLWDNIVEGVLSGVGQTAFHSEQDIYDMYGEGWEILDITHNETLYISDTGRVPYCQWMAVARKTA